MTTLYRTEIRLILRLLCAERDNADAMRNRPGQAYQALWNLEYDNTTAICEKLEAILNSNVKRIEVR